MEDKHLEQVLWPIAVVQDRYMGTYTGGRWVAIPDSDRVDFETGVWGSDSEAMVWAVGNKNAYGVGDTPDLALADLYEKIARFGMSARYNPDDRIKMLESAIKRHKETVLANPSKTAEAEDVLWELLED